MMLQAQVGTKSKRVPGGKPWCKWFPFKEHGLPATFPAAPSASDPAGCPLLEASPPKGNSVQNRKMIETTKGKSSTVPLPLLKKAWPTSCHLCSSTSFTWLPRVQRSAGAPGVLPLPSELLVSFRITKQHTPGPYMLVSARAGSHPGFGPVSVTREAKASQRP